jgi:hypothetical protein
VLTGNAQRSRQRLARDTSVVAGRQLFVATTGRHARSRCTGGSAACGPLSDEAELRDALAGYIDTMPHSHALNDQADPQGKRDKADDDRDHGQHHCGDRRLAIRGLTAYHPVPRGKAEARSQTAEEKAKQRHAGDQRQYPQKQRPNTESISGSTAGGRLQLFGHVRDASHHCC